MRFALRDGDFWLLDLNLLLSCAHGRGLACHGGHIDDAGRCCGVGACDFVRVGRPGM